ncbi:hypothetical protein ACI7RC_23740 [Brevibacillus sp. B_LB10_24]|uniref:hypothetical protein n=1 Tax=Brevibacillus sp. B_LB10_24 TaxID=3380645 RepID=UPI0038B6EA1A
MDPTKKSKLIILTFLGLAIIFGLIAYFGMKNSAKAQVELIHQEIAARGGTVTKIEVMPPDESPFPTAGKGNTIFKIDYEKSGQSHIAWYCSINDSSIIREQEQWKFDE